MGRVRRGRARALSAPEDNKKLTSTYTVKDTQPDMQHGCDACTAPGNHHFVPKGTLVWY
jgi:hypothetical protein